MDETSMVPPLPGLPPEDASDDGDAVLISALEHFSYCPRQCALIHREQTFDENIYTLRGRILHEKVDEPEGVIMGRIRVERALPLWSATLHLSGKADLIEFHGETPYPVEYKHGPAYRGRHADVQLCAQALCLEEMLGVPVLKGAVYHYTSRKRREVVFTPALRERVRQMVQEVRQMLKSDELPPAVADVRCIHCSLQDSCLPHILSRRERLSAFQGRLYRPLAIQEAPHERS